MDWYKVLYGIMAIGVSLFLVYTGARIIAMAIFRSYFTEKKRQYVAFLKEMSKDANPN